MASTSWQALIIAAALIHVLCCAPRVGWRPLGVAQLALLRTAAVTYSCSWKMIFCAADHQTSNDFDRYLVENAATLSFSCSQTAQPKCPAEPEISAKASTGIHRPSKGDPIVVAIYPEKLRSQRHWSIQHGPRFIDKSGELTRSRRKTS
jgi:hypothetical protein